MTARGELYIDEDCRDFFEKKLNEWFGEGKWYLDGSDFSGYWDMKNFPESVEVNVVDEDRNPIGKVLITNRFEIEVDEYEDRCIECYPEEIELLNKCIEVKE